MGLELDAKQASRLRQWFHKSLRAVTNLPAHLTKVSNEELCIRFGVKEPISALHDLTCNKLRKLHNLPTDHISADPCVIDHWAECERALGVLRHTTHLVTAQMLPGCAGVPCPECGQYFSSVKAVCQHAAQRHGIKTVALTEIEYSTNRRNTSMKACRNACTAANAVGPGWTTSHSHECLRSCL